MHNVFIEPTGLACGHRLPLMHRDSGSGMGIHVHMAYFSIYVHTNIFTVHLWHVYTCMCTVYCYSIYWIWIWTFIHVCTVCTYMCTCPCPCMCTLSVYSIPTSHWIHVETYTDCELLSVVVQATLPCIISADEGLRSEMFCLSDFNCVSIQSSTTHNQYSCLNEVMSLYSIIFCNVDQGSNLSLRICVFQGGRSRVWIQCDSGCSNLQLAQY